MLSEADGIVLEAAGGVVSAAAYDPDSKDQLWSVDAAHEVILYRIVNRKIVRIQRDGVPVKSAGGRYLGITEDGPVLLPETVIINKQDGSGSVTASVTDLLDGNLFDTYGFPENYDWNSVLDLAGQFALCTESGASGGCVLRSADGHVLGYADGKTTVMEERTGHYDAGEMRDASDFTDAYLLADGNGKAFLTAEDSSGVSSGERNIFDEKELWTSDGNVSLGLYWSNLGVDPAEDRVFVRSHDGRYLAFSEGSLILLPAEIELRGTDGNGTVRVPVEEFLDGSAFAAYGYPDSAYDWGSALKSILNIAVYETNGADEGAALRPLRWRYPETKAVSGASFTDKLIVVGEEAGMVLASVDGKVVFVPEDAFSENQRWFADEAKPLTRLSSSNPALGSETYMGSYSYSTSNVYPVKDADGRYLVYNCAESGKETLLLLNPEDTVKLRVLAGQIWGAIECTVEDLFQENVLAGRGTDFRNSTVGYRYYITLYFDYQPVVYTKAYGSDTYRFETTHGRVLYASPEETLYFPGNEVTGYPDDFSYTGQYTMALKGFTEDSQRVTVHASEERFLRGNSEGVYVHAAGTGLTYTVTNSPKPDKTPEAKPDIKPDKDPSKDPDKKPDKNSGNNGGNNAGENSGSNSGTNSDGNGNSGSSQQSGTGTSDTENSTSGSRTGSSTADAGTAGSGSSSAENADSRNEAYAVLSGERSEESSTAEAAAGTEKPDAQAAAGETGQEAAAADSSGPERLGTSENGRSHWSLLNLLLALGTVLAGILPLFVKRKKEEGGESRKESGGSGKWLLLIGLLPAAAAVVTFLLTEDLRQAILIVDKWTILMAIYLAAGAVMAFLSGKAKS